MTNTPHRWFGIFIASLLVLSLSGKFLSGQEPQWFRGNLHTHSLWSDGNDFPEMITRWYANHGYHFLAITDHNVLSRGERWMSVRKIVDRGGTNAMEKYVKAMGNQWVETRNDGNSESPNTAVRLKTLEEYRGKFEKPGKFLILTGEEISDSVKGLPVHMNATNLAHLIRPAGGTTVREAISANMRSAIDQAKSEGREILVHLNHPNFGWAVTAEDLAAVLEEQFFEIYNGHPAVNQLGDDVRPSLEKMWDIANTIRIDKLKAAPLFGLATDDSHKYHSRKGSITGRGWIMVRAKQLEPESIIKAVKQGNFYASSGVHLQKIGFNRQTGQLSIQIQPVSGQTFTTRFVGTPKEYDSSSKPQLGKDGKPLRSTRIYSPDVGMTFATAKGPHPTYQMTGKELYVRAIVTSSAKHPLPSFDDQRQQAWVQPVIWEPSTDR